jgi:hypothetical protein
MARDGDWTLRNGGRCSGLSLVYYRLSGSKVEEEHARPMARRLQKCVLNLRFGSNSRKVVNRRSAFRALVFWKRALAC